MQFLTNYLRQLPLIATKAASRIIICRSTGLDGEE